MAFTAKDVQTLREKTGVGMMDCKKALTETNGDMEKAIDILREKGLATAAKKAGRVAAEGIVASYQDGKCATLVEINCEPNFVAKVDSFVKLGATVAKTVAQQNPADVDALLKLQAADSTKTVEEEVQDVFMAVRENMKVRRFARVEGVASTYIHGGGSVGVIVTFDADPAIASNEEFQIMGKDVAMQVAAMKPEYLNPEAVPAEVIEHEKEIQVTQMKNDPKMASKPENVLVKIVEGKMGKYYSEVCLLNQEFVKDSSMTVAKYIDSVAKKLGTEIKATGFVCFKMGDGLEKRDENFADEIASMIK